MADKYQGLVAGREKMVEGLVVSTGASDAGKIPAVGSDGKLDLTLMPNGVGPLVITGTVNEALSAGDYVNIVPTTGNIRLADATNDRPAHGFVKAAYAIAATATVYLRTGINDAVSGMTPGARQYLSASGARTETVPALPSEVIHQFLGVAKSATVMVVDIEDEIVL